MTESAEPEPTTGPDQPSVREFTGQFLQAFENLDMPSFIECFTDDAMVFLPAPFPSFRFEGKVAIQSRFQDVFAAIRGDNSGGPPYHQLRPENLVVQLLSADAAIVSFHLRSEQRVARRSLVLRMTGAGWRIVHLHASSVTVAQ